MRPSRSTALACLSSIAMLACGAAENPTVTAAESEAVAAEIQARFAELLSTMEALDVEAALTYFAEDDALVHAADGQVTSGAAEVREAYRANFGGVAEFLHVWVDPGHTTVLSPSSAVHTTWFDEAFVTTAGDTLRLTGIWTTGWRLADGQWRIVHNAASHMAAE